MVIGRQEHPGASRKGQRFKDNGNGTITDKLTNLTWDKDADRFVKDAPTKRTWVEAISDCNGLADNGNDLTDGSQAGDWRLANVKELQSLIDFGEYQPAVSDTLGTGQWSPGDPFFNVKFFDVNALWYWSATTNASFSTVAWSVTFNGGGVGNRYKSTNCFVWCVRGGP